MNLSDSIFIKRESKRSYLDKPVPRDVLERIYERIRWSASGGNMQPWRFIFCIEPDARARAAKALSRGNLWATAAPILGALCARQSDDAVREDDPVLYYQFSSGMAMMSLLLGATEEGLMAHGMGGFDAHILKKELSIPDEYHVFCMFTLGYKGPIDLLDERTRKKDEAPRTRKPISEIISENSFKF